MFADDDLLPISALQHLAFCPRQWALIHLEGSWRDNRLTVQGKHLHERADAGGTQVRGHVRIARGLRLCSYRLGLTGQADVVEFHRLAPAAGAPSPPADPGAQSPPDRAAASTVAQEHDPLAFLDSPADATPAAATNVSPPHMEDSSAGTAAERLGPAPAAAEPVTATTAPATQSGCVLAGLPGLWRPFPVEYKRGRPKADHCDLVQLCAQALCLEEMLTVAVPAGAMFYGRPRRRLDVSFDATLRAETESLVARLHELTRATVTPPAVYEKKCRNCSLIDLCQPKITAGRRSAQRYLSDMLANLDEPEAPGTDHNPPTTPGE